MKNVLLVDDDEVCNFLNTHLLQTAGIAKEIHSALNGKQAIDLLNNYYMGSSAFPDVILLDLNMPIMDGFEFLEAFKRINLAEQKKVTIIIVTSSHNPNDLEKARQIGVTGYLTKPVTVESLMAILDN